jgi:hypothetical protein
LIAGRSTRLPETDHAISGDVAVKLGFESAEMMQETLKNQMKGIRAAYESIVG